LGHQGSQTEFTLRETHSDPRPRQFGALTKTQLAIIELIAQGRTDKEIAYTVGMSYRTVRTHLERLYEINGVHSRAALVAVVALRRQLSELHK